MKNMVSLFCQNWLSLISGGHARAKNISFNETTSNKGVLMMIRLTDVRDTTEDVVRELNQILMSTDPWSHEKLTKIRNDLNECAESVQLIRDTM